MSLIDESSKSFETVATDPSGDAELFEATPEAPESSAEPTEPSAEAVEETPGISELSTSADLTESGVIITSLKFEQC